MSDGLKVIPDALKIIPDGLKVISDGPALLFFSSISTDRRNRPLQSLHPLRRYKICLRIFTPVRAKTARTGDPDSGWAHACITAQI
jgi:hypothetical protein